MLRLIAGVTAAAAIAGCAHGQQLAAQPAPVHCYTESGWLDSSSGCSERQGFPDCYLVCPDKGTRQRL